ncbi:MAG TPA: nucleotidyltransferase domain-containing protein [Armatimonadota bacterium]|nr:nucleotidyltransferase domain-containing protein [Armatimonadota bacterium]
MQKTTRNIARRFTPRQWEVISAVKAAARHVLPDADIILYGSRARGTAGPESDWDFLILTDETVTVALEETMRKAMDALSLEIAEVISAFLENRQTWKTPLLKATPYHQAIEQEGIAV